ncbi:pentapeptide repeat protein [Calothrix sp. NIES-2098]|nr:pentapeptide repeat protein [Calothrix sp. NIES-2098]
MHSHRLFSQIHSGKNIQGWRLSQEYLQPELHNLIAGQPIIIKVCLFLILVVLSIISGIVSGFFGSWYFFNISLTIQPGRIELFWMIIIIIAWLTATIRQGIAKGLRAAIVYFFLTLIITEILVLFNLLPVIDNHIYPAIDHLIQHLAIFLAGITFSLFSLLTGSFVIAVFHITFVKSKLDRFQVSIATFIIIIAVIATIILYLSGGVDSKFAEQSLFVKSASLLGGMISGFGFGILSLIVTKFSHKHSSHFYFLHSWAIAAGTWGSTSFYNLDLSNIDFTGSLLANSDFRASNFYRTCLKGVKGLDRARLDDRYIDLTNYKVQKLLIDGKSKDKEFSNLNLQGAYLRSADMRYFNLRGTNLKGADLQDADLRHSILVGAQVTGVNFTDADLTGICIEDWHVNSKTCFARVKCDYVFRKLDKKGETIEQYPVGRYFEKGEFEALFQEVEEVVELVFKEGVNWRALSFTFRKFQLEDDGLGLELKGVEQRGDLWVVKVTHKEGVLRQQVEQRVGEIYDMIKGLIAVKEPQINKLLDIAADQAGALKEANKRSFGNSFYITGSTITNLAGSGEINYDEAASKIRSFVANCSEPEQSQKLVQNLLEQFQNQSVAISVDKQAELIEQLILTEAKKDPFFKQFVVQQGQQIADGMVESAIASAIRAAHSQLI